MFKKGNNINFSPLTTECTNCIYNGILCTNAAQPTTTLYIQSVTIIENDINGCLYQTTSFYICQDNE